MASLRAADTLSIRSLSHGAVAALFALARELDVTGTIDRHLKLSGRRSRKPLPPGTRRPPLRNDGLSVGESLLLVSLGRACHATSKRGFAPWARNTTLGELFKVDVERLTSQHFWDQMEQLPVATIAPIEREIVGRVIERLEIPLETLLYDATNFFTFIASTNTHAELPARGHSKQKRHDLRQVGVALLCTRQEAVPLCHKVYGGQVPDAKSFAEALTTFRQRLVEMGQPLESLTLVYDKGNVSRANQSLVDTSNLHYVASLSAASQRALLAEANPKMQPVALDDGEEVLAYRTRRPSGARNVPSSSCSPSACAKVRGGGFSSTWPPPNGGSLGWSKPSREENRGAIAPASNTTSTPTSEDGSTSARSSRSICPPTQRD